MGRRSGADHHARKPAGRCRAVRFHLVHPADRQISPADRRSAADHAGHQHPGPCRAAVFPERGRQSAGARNGRYAQRAGDRLCRGVAVGNGVRLAAHPALFRNQPENRRRTGRAPVPAPDGAADGLFREPPRGRYRDARASAGNDPRIPHQCLADGAGRSAVHDRVPGRDVALFGQAVPDLGADHPGLCAGCAVHHPPAAGAYRGTL